MMEIEDGKKLVNKGMKVILSCETEAQLINSVKYADLVFRKLSNTCGLLNNGKFISLIERSIGYAQCKIKWKIEPLK